MEEKIKQMIVPLLDWYEKNKRILPWREKIPNPYHVWLSEVMLQQTRIEAVKKYYERFLMQLPTIEDLAKVEEERLLKLWEGLGYYNRARNLKKAAQMIVEKYDGKMPDKWEELQKLPGVGEYTAGAIGSICFGLKVPAVDGNVLRVISRVIGSKENVLLPETKKKITKLLQDNMPEEAGKWNEALMELGEIICLPNGEPLCQQCPIQNICKALKENEVNQIPVRIKEQKRKIEEKTVFIVQHEDKVAIQKRADEGILAGMYEFPHVEGKKKEEEIASILKEWEIQNFILKEKRHGKHIFTHKQWNMVAYYIQVKEINTNWEWVTKKQLEEKYAMPTAFKKFPIELR